MTDEPGPALDVVDVAGLIADLAADGATVATAESVTGGRLVAVLTSVPGSSAVVRGAVVAYSSEVKSSMLGVDPEALGLHGPVSALVAQQMAQGARDRLGATYGVSTTGEAGPDSASGQPVGTVFVAVAGPRAMESREWVLTGARAEIQQGAVTGALLMLAQARRAAGADPGAGAEGGFGNNGD